MFMEDWTWKYLPRLWIDWGRDTEFLNEILIAIYIHMNVLSVRK